MMPFDLKTVGTAVGAIATLIGVTYTGGSWVDTRYAHQDKLELVSMRLEQQILTDRVEAIRQRMYTIRERHGEDQSVYPATVKEEYAQLKAELDDLMEELKGIRREYRQMNQAPSKYYDRQQEQIMKK